MTSLRHKSPDKLDPRRSASRQAGPGSPRDDYLDAARACILDVGWRRTTLTEVARRAGVSRMTIYRSWADMPTLLGDLMTREWSGVVEAAVSDQGSDDPSDDPGNPDGGASPSIDRLVAGIAATVRALRDNELFVRIVDLDPELILPYLFARRGRSQDLILALADDAIRAGQQAGEIRVGNPTAIARGLLLAAHGHVLSSHTMVDDEVSQAELDDELGVLLRNGLAP